MSWQPPALPGNLSKIDLFAWQSALARDNQAALASSLSDLESGCLGLVVDLAQAETGVLFVIDKVTGELVCRVVHGQFAQGWPGKQLRIEEGSRLSSIRHSCTLLLEDAGSPELFPGENLLLPLALPGSLLAVL